MAIAGFPSTTMSGSYAMQGKLRSQTTVTLYMAMLPSPKPLGPGSTWLKECMQIVKYIPPQGSSAWHICQRLARVSDSLGGKVKFIS